MNPNHALSRHGAWLLMGLVISCLTAASATAFLLPPRFETHPEAIGYVLRQHDVAYEQIRLSRAWPDTLSRQTYSADVLIQLRGAEQISGRIECRVGRSQCYLYVRRLGIAHESVPELSSTPAWLAQIQRYLSALATRARGLVGG